MKVDLPLETWRAVHALMLDAPVSARVAVPIIQAFEAAMQAAMQPPAEAPSPE